MIKAVIVILILLGLFLYVIVHVSAQSVDDDMQKRLDEEQARIVSEMDGRSQRGDKKG